MSGDALKQMHDRYYVREVDSQPKVYWRITDNWLELTVRFVAWVIIIITCLVGLAHFSHIIAGAA